MVQNPASRPGTAVVLRGKQGTGKSLFCSYFSKIFGCHAKTVSHSKHLVGQFNAHLQDALLVLAEEAFWAGDKSAEGVLKDLVTGDTLRIERKHVDVQFAPNFVRLIVTSNNEWVVPAGLEERRFLVLDVSDEKMQNKQYFSELVEEMKGGGVEALLHFLLHHDYSDIDLRTIPTTGALLEQKLKSMSPFDKFWFESLMNGTIDPEGHLWPTMMRTDEFRDHYYKFVGGLGTKFKGSDTEIGIWLNKRCPGVSKKKKKLKALTTGDGMAMQSVQKNFYEFPALGICRAQFECAAGTSFPWEG